MHTVPSFCCTAPDQRQARRKLAVGAWTIITLGASFAAAQPADRGASPPTLPRVTLNYQAPTNCPPRERFIAEVRERTKRVELADAREGAQALPPLTTLWVELSPSPTGYRGRLELLTASGERSVRDFAEASCEEAVSALALVTALSVDPLSTPPNPTPDLTPPAPPPHEDRPLPHNSAQPFAPQASAPGPATPGPGAPGQEAPGPVTSVLARSPVHRWQGNVAVGALLLWGPAPVPLVALAPSLELEKKRPPSRVLRGVFAPRFRVTPLLAQSGVIGPDERWATFRLTGARLDSCPWHLASQHWDLAPCGVAELGSLAVHGQNLPEIRQSTRGWYALGLEAELEWTGAIGFIRGSVGFRTPLVRHNFVVLPSGDRLVHEQPWLAGSLGLSAGLHFP